MLVASMSARYTQARPPRKLAFQVGDVLLQLDRESITGFDVLRKILHPLEPGKSYAMRIRRENEPITLTVIPDEFNP